MTGSMWSRLCRAFTLIELLVVVADPFAKGYRSDGWGRAIPSSGLTLADTTTYPGMGIAGHRRVYNVLYGDGHVKLFGDPQEKMIWH